MSKNYLEKLVALESISGNEQAIFDYIKSVVEPEQHEVFSADTWLAVKLSGKDSSRAFMMNGHVDTVPPGDVDAWQSDPYTLTESGDILVGLGVTDMKSGLAAMLGLATAEDLVPAKDVWLVFVAGEETDGVGSEDFVKWFEQNGPQYKMIDAMVAEPTSLDYIGVGHRGNMAFSATIDGDGGHASRPHEIKQHAILRAYDLISAIDELNEDWSKNRVHPELNVPTVTVTSVSTGHNNAANQFPTVCKLTIDVRTTPEVAGEVEATLKQLAEPLGGVKLQELSPPFSPVATSPDSQIIKKLQSLAPELSTQPFPGATDLSWLHKIADNCIVFGPGDVAQMHKVNESMPSENLSRYLEIMKRLIAED